MKWIGQHIIDLIARFRSDVYLEDIDTGTIASGGNLGLDSNNKIVKAAQSSGGISHDGSTANGVLTFKDADEATVEANLTFNGNSLNVNGDAEIASDGKLYFRDNYSFIHSPSANDLLIIAAADFEIASSNIVLDAGTNIELDAASAMSFKVGDDEFLDFKNVNNTFARFHAESGANTSFTLYEKGGDSLVDYCSFSVAEHGATMISTIDQAAAQAHFEIEADGNITLDSIGKINLEIGDGDYINMYNDTNKFAAFYAESGAGSDLYMYELGGDSTDDYFQIHVDEHGATGLITRDNGAAAAAHLELDADGDIILDAAGQIKLEPGTSVLWDSLALTGIQASGETFSDDDVSLMTSAAIDDRIRVKSKHVLRCNAFYANGNWVQNSLFIGNSVGNNPYNWNDQAAVGGAISTTNSFTIIGDDEQWGIVLPVDISKIEVQCSVRPSGTPGAIDFSVAVYTGVRSSDSSSDLTLTKIGHQSVSFNSTNQRYKQNDLTIDSLTLSAGDMIYVGVGTEDPPNNAKNGRGYMNITVTER